MSDEYLMQEVVMRDMTIEFLEEENMKLNLELNVMEELRAENEKLRAALAFYADDDNWRLNGPLDANSGNFTGGPATAALKEKGK